MFITSLRKAGYIGPIIILATSDVPQDHLDKITAAGATIRNVPKLSARMSGDKSLLNMLTKLHAWNLVEYEQIIFYDSDFVFLKNPATAFTECRTEFCAAGDTGIRSIMPEKSPTTYFNSGFMVIRPSKEKFNELLKSVHLAENTRFVDQDLLNAIFKDKWQKISNRYNIMHVSGPIGPDSVAIHEKLWILRSKYREPQYVWNQFPAAVVNVASHSADAAPLVPARDSHPPIDNSIRKNALRGRKDEMLSHINRHPKHTVLRANGVEARPQYNNYDVSLPEAWRIKARPQLK